MARPPPRPPISIPGPRCMHGFERPCAMCEWGFARSPLRALVYWLKGVL